MQVVRLGRPDRVRPELLQYCVDVPKPGEMQVDWGAKMAALRQASCAFKSTKAQILAHILAQKYKY
jgi:hypothetical protein